MDYFCPYSTSDGSNARLGALGIYTKISLYWPFCPPFLRFFNFTLLPLFPADSIPYISRHFLAALPYHSSCPHQLFYHYFTSTIARFSHILLLFPSLSYIHGDITLDDTTIFSGSDILPSRLPPLHIHQPQDNTPVATTDTMAESPERGRFAGRDYGFSGSVCYRGVASL